MKVSLQNTAWQPFIMQKYTGAIISQIFKSFRVSEAILGVRSINIINLGHYIGGNNRLYNVKHIIYDLFLDFTAGYSG